GTVQERAPCVPCPVSGTPAGSFSTCWRSKTSAACGRPYGQRGSCVPAGGQADRIPRNSQALACFAWSRFLSSAPGCEPEACAFYLDPGNVIGPLRLPDLLRTTPGHPQAATPAACNPPRRRLWQLPSHREGPARGLGRVRGSATQDVRVAEGKII